MIEDEVVGQKTALITGVAGQDGSYLAELLCGQGYEVWGTSHRESGEVICGDVVVEVSQLDLTDTAAVNDLVAQKRPDEIYNLAARASSSQLFDDPIQTAEVNGIATVRFLEAIRQFSPTTRFCQAASSEIFAGAASSPQNEATEIAPINSYGAAKAYALHMLRMYRSRYGLHAGTAILFNHESPRRGEHFVTRKISKTVALIEAGKADVLSWEIWIADAIGDMPATMQKHYGRCCSGSAAMTMSLQPASLIVSGISAGSLSSMSVWTIWITSK